jgi:hypothetical protein
MDNFRRGLQSLMRARAEKCSVASHTESKHQNELIIIDLFLGPEAKGM